MFTGITIDHRFPPLSPPQKKSEDWSPGRMIICTYSCARVARQLASARKQKIRFVFYGSRVFRNFIKYFSYKIKKFHSLRDIISEPIHNINVVSFSSFNFHTTRFIAKKFSSNKTCGVKIEIWTRWNNVMYGFRNDVSKWMKLFFSCKKNILWNFWTLWSHKKQKEFFVCERSRAARAQLCRCTSVDRIRKCKIWGEREEKR